MALDKSQTLAVCAASLLMPRASHVLSPFEKELVASIGYRVMRHGSEADITSAEWPPFEAALQAMCVELAMDYQTVVRGKAA